MNLDKLLRAAILSVILIGCARTETPEVSSVSLNTATIEMYEGEVYNLVATILPNGTEYSTEAQYYKIF